MNILHMYFNLTGPGQEARGCQGPIMSGTGVAKLLCGHKPGEHTCKGTGRKNNI